MKIYDKIMEERSFENDSRQAFTDSNIIPLSSSHDPRPSSFSSIPGVLQSTKFHASENKSSETAFERKPLSEIVPRELEKSTQTNIVRSMTISTQTEYIQVQKLQTDQATSTDVSMFDVDSMKENKVTQETQTFQENVDLKNCFVGIGKKRGRPRKKCKAVTSASTAIQTPPLKNTTTPESTALQLQPEKPNRSSRKITQKQLETKLLERIKFVEISRAFERSATDSNTNDDDSGFTIKPAELVKPTTRRKQPAPSRKIMESLDETDHLDDSGFINSDIVDLDETFEEETINNVKETESNSTDSIKQEGVVSSGDLEFEHPSSGLMEVPQETSELGEKILTCVICNKAFKGEKYFLSHLASHTADRPHVCHVCNVSFSKPSMLEVHRRKHCRNKPYRCEICGKTFKTKSGHEGHMNMHTGDNLYECDICKRAFGSKGNLQTHRASHSRAVPSYNCTICGETFTRINLFIRHKYAHSIEMHAEVYTQECLHCGKRFTNPEHLQDHLLLHSGKRPHYCVICDKTFRTSSDLSSHCRMHVDTRTHQCHICQKAFKMRKGLQRHMLVHSDVKAHICEICGSTFKHSQGLKIHQNMHTDEKPFACSQCDFRCRQAGNLSSHMLTHSDFKAFTCDRCGQQFKKRSHLKRHEITHSDVKPYKCDQCGKAFSRFLAKRKHMLIHTGQRPYICNQCGKAFRQKANLRVHNLIHDNKKDFTCDVCDASFRRPAHLRRHRLIHTGEKPYGCQICGKRFTRPVCLPNHYKRHRMNGDHVPEGIEKGPFVKDVPANKDFYHTNQESHSNEPPSSRGQQLPVPQYMFTVPFHNPWSNN